MRRLISTYAAEDGVGEELLTIVKRFDDLLVGQTDLPRLASAAAEMLGAQACALDLLNDRLISAGPDTSSELEQQDVGRALILAIDAEQAEPGEALRCSALDRVWAAAILEHGQGRLGIVWTPKPEANLTAADDLVLERFAQAASIAIQQVGRAREVDHVSDPTALERLIVGELDEDSLAKVIRATNLDAGLRYSVLALALEPAQASVAVATAAVGRALDQRSVVWRPVTVLNVPLVVATGDLAVCDSLTEAVGDAARTGWRLKVGVGEPGPLEHLSRSAAQAREALAFHSAGRLGGVAWFASLGALHLLTEIPRSALENDRDLAAIARLDGARTGVDDLAVLIAYCETGSLRQTGERIFLHHSSVEYRLRRIEETLGFPLTTPDGRFRALLAATIHRLGKAGQL